PLGFAPLLALMGLLSLPAIRLRSEHRPVAVVLLAGPPGAAGSTVSAVHHPKNPQDGPAPKLALARPRYRAARCGARAAPPALVKAALIVFAWGLAFLGLLLLCEAWVGGELYRRLQVACCEPIRPDLARKNLGQSTFVLALLWPLAAVGGR